MMHDYKPIRIAVILLLLLAGSKTVFGQTDSVTVNNDKTLALTSKALGEKRTIWIHLPADYNTTSTTYPVLYLLDGDSHFKYVSEAVEYLSDYDRNRMPQMIVVAILNVDRTRDFTPLHSLIFDGKVDTTRMGKTGGGAKFLQFIKNELVPYVDNNYRVEPYRILLSHSLGGLFALYAKETAPDLFQANIMMSPAIYGDYTKILTDFAPFLQNHPQLRGKNFISIGNENTQKVDSLTLVLKSRANPLFTWKFEQYPEENHFSVTYKSVYDGLRFIYSHWFIDYYSQVKMSITDINTHFGKLSDEFGYTMSPSENLLNNCGYQQLNLKNMEEAIGIFKENVQRHPTSSNAYDSLGEAYMKNGNKALAIKNYKRSIELNPGNTGGKEILKQLESK
ncbi:alpha/beta hydrolase-fold protein [Mucilaginibacter sp. RCC_168]|uniref:alpha/beta hydrolase-fold protein n=1 Tax=Mucilaginibacter sp. RCC_168 TaxID=3239221 RepID=UPI003525D1EA